jgi:putative ubiquitin-RnfH superfamily antitoxin RatB of RatAB toxin-antitoxin module
MATETHKGCESAITVLVVMAGAPRCVLEQVVHLEPGATAAEAVTKSQLLAGKSDAEIDGLSLAVWGKRVNPYQALLDGDRLELLQPLKVDPKVARRERFVRQGAKSAGLFAKTKPGKKAGY